MKYFFFFIATIGTVILLHTPVFAQESVNVDVAHAVTVQDDLSATVKTTINIDNEDNTQIIGGYRYTFIFNNPKNIAVTFNGQSVKFEQSKLEYTVIDMNFEEQVLDYGEKGLIEITYTIPQLLTQTYAGFYELYIPQSRFDEDVLRYSTTIIYPQTFPSVAFAGADSFERLDNSLVMYGPQPEYVIWTNGYSVTHEFGYDITEPSRIALPIGSNEQDVFMAQSIEADFGYVDAEENWWAEYSAKEEPIAPRFIIQKNKEMFIPNDSYDYTDYSDLKESFDSLDEVINHVRNHYHDTISIPVDSNQAYDVEAFQSRISEEQQSQVDVCMYLISIAQRSGFGGQIEYGYNTSTLLPTVNRTKPSLWCRIYSATESRVFDFLVENQSGIVLDTKSSINRVVYGTWNPDSASDALGQFGENIVATKYLESEKKKDNALITIDAKFPETIYASRHFDIEITVSNNSSRVFTTSDLYVDDSHLPFEQENKPILLPHQTTIYPVHNIAIGQSWDTGTQNVTITLQDSEQTLASQNFSVELQRDITFYLMVGGIGLLIPGFIVVLLIKHRSRNNINTHVPS